ncbi:DNA N-6-adenine-methyltransferase [Runella aurantiaca]|uniref:Adenine methyltransferase n=1 Tax=Runella aurantiaca TaxID=2282308 RepID=A0A369I6Q8_9BACT|nr:DNA N-6-adenine-methyltransferase [Runella aurantiaca]RDB03193.1 adenine methyltransferase [Runella aurantiaca]
MNSSFERSENTKVEWLTPPDLVKKLGVFDLDPCSPVNAPFLHALHNFTVEDDGLLKEWFGRVYLNPPYGKGMDLWLQKLKLHGNGIALIFARTETKCFFDNVWNDADGVLFVKGRIRFYHVSGEQGGTPGAPSVFIAYGKENALALKDAGIEGRFLMLKS